MNIWWNMAEWISGLFTVREQLNVLKPICDEKWSLWVNKTSYQSVTTVLPSSQWQSLAYETFEVSR